MKRFGIFCLLLIFPLLAGCVSQPATADAPMELAEPAAVAALPTLAQLAPSITLTVAQSRTPIPTSTATVPPTATLPPTWTLTSIPYSTSAPVPTVDNIDRTCPDPPPLKPVYDRYVTGDEPWPTPQPNPEPHFWLSKPLPGGGRYLHNTNFPYGYDGNGALLLHNGIDAGGGGLGTLLPAVADGTIVVAQKDNNELYGWRCNWYGELVVLELDRQWNGQPVYALYGHVLEIKVEEGQQVKAGEAVAEVGVGGAASVPHLHFEVRVGENDFGATRNPLLWVQPPETRGLIVGRLIDSGGRPWHGVWLSAINNETRGETVSWSYLDDPLSLINPDADYAENFVIPDLVPGEYTVATQIQGQVYRAEVTVVGGEISTVELVTEPYRSATATPAATPTPE